MTKTRAEVFSELALLLLGEEVEFMDDIKDSRLYEHLEYDEPQEDEKDETYYEYWDDMMDAEREMHR